MGEEEGADVGLDVGDVVGCPVGAVVGLAVGLYVGSTQTSQFRRAMDAQTESNCSSQQYGTKEQSCSSQVASSQPVLPISCEQQFDDGV